MNAIVNPRVCVVIGWMAPAVAAVVVGVAVAATASGNVIFEAMTVAVVAVATAFMAPATTAVGVAALGSMRAIAAVPPTVLVGGVVPAAAAGVLVVVGPRLLFLLVVGCVPAIRPAIVMAWGTVEPVVVKTVAACEAIVPGARVVPAVGPAIVVAWGAVEPVLVKAVAACRAIVLPIANPLLARATSSLIVLQLAILVAAGMVMVEEATAAPWMMMTALALGPVPIRLMMMKSG
jgi:hypothetical protein